MRLHIKKIVREALLEDLGQSGDRTSQAVLSPSAQTQAHLRTRENGTLCGLDIARMSFHLMDENLVWHTKHQDGDSLQAGDTIASIKGAAQSILASERVALNFLTHLCGIATATAHMVALAGTTPICCTRKTTPNLRILEKYAVQCGGGYNHRFGLYDAILIKDNHLALCPLKEAIARARRACGHMVKIEVEADRLDMIEEIIAAGADAVLLDNMSPAELREAVHIIDGRIIAEASGRITPDNVADYAKIGIDVISSGWLTHSASNLDIGLDIYEA